MADSNAKKGLISNLSAYLKGIFFVYKNRIKITHSINPSCRLFIAFILLYKLNSLRVELID